VCDDGIDNDGDSFIDYPDDPGCRSVVAIIENPQCQDGIHNDGDGMMDYDAGYSVNGSADPAGPDPHCVDKPWRNREAVYPQRRSSYPCGLGAELVLLLPPLMWLWRRRSFH
jgi:hypothetical protein